MIFVVVFGCPGGFLGQGFLEDCEIDCVFFRNLLLLSLANYVHYLVLDQETHCNDRVSNTGGETGEGGAVNEDTVEPLQSGHQWDRRKGFIGFLIDTILNSYTPYKHTERS